MALPLVFAGATDDTGFADGDKLLISMASTDSSKSLSFSFTETVVIKRGILCFSGAPFGAYFDCHVLSGETVVHSFAKGFNIYGTGMVEMDTGEESFLEQGLTMKIEVYNSNGTGDEDAASAFKVWGNLLVRRLGTV